MERHLLDAPQGSNPFGRGLTHLAGWIASGCAVLVAAGLALIFAASLVVIAAGQSVDFRNDERRPIEHNVFSRTPGTEFNLGLYKPGTPDKVVRFETPGAVRLYCSIHRYMDGVVYVCPTPLFSKVNRDGTYRIDNIPPGEYRLKTWQRNARFEDREVAVRVAGATDAELNLEMSRK